jgi:hypothetical protein
VKRVDEWRLIVFEARLSPHRMGARVHRAGCDDGRGEAVIGALVIAALVAIALVVYLVGRALRRDPFPVMRGRTLDLYAESLGLKRKRWESDRALRARMTDEIRRPLR